jgi:F0F1-type ATP synthase delta subunit
VIAVENLHNSLRRLANGLVTISLDNDSLVSDERVMLVVRVLKETYGGVRLRSIIAAYLSALEKHIALTSLKIEHRGKLSDAAASAIGKHFERMLNRKLRTRVTVSESLIAGIRIGVADIVVGYSIADALDAHRKRAAAAHLQW